jgi:hydrogenase expression/formation protein HypE
VNEIIGMTHGSGGNSTHRLLERFFIKHFKDLGLQPHNDAALLELDNSTTIAITTDGFVVNPLFFKGSNIGELSITGTCNDLAVMGAEPKWLTCGFILGTGTPFYILEKVVKAMSQAAIEQEVQLVAGDTKVVEHHEKPPYILITTSGIGIIRTSYPWHINNVRPDDTLIISGTIGEHTLAVLNARNGWFKHSSISSDCAPLYPMLKSLHSQETVHWVRDVTRSGLAGVCNELSDATGLIVELSEESIPISEEVNGWCEVLGYDPLTLANEGKALLAVDSSAKIKILELLRRHPLGKDAAIIGELKTSQDKPMVILNTTIGGKRIIPSPSRDHFPRIC